MIRHGIDISKEKIADFCRRNHIRKLAFFGSFLRDDFRPDSDIDVLVDFEPEHVPGFRLIEIEEELSALLGGRKIDMVTEKYLNRRLRDQVLTDKEAMYTERRPAF